MNWEDELEESLLKISVGRNGKDWVDEPVDAIMKEISPIISSLLKKQREILSDNIGSWKKSMKFAIQHAIEQQEQEYKEDYFLGREEAFKYAIKMHDEHFNAPEPEEKL